MRARALALALAAALAAVLSAEPARAQTAPGEVTDLSASVGVFGDSAGAQDYPSIRATLRWTAPSGTITGYEYRFCEGESCDITGETWHSTNQSAGSTAYSFSRDDIGPGLTYRFQVRAVNDAGKGAVADAVSAKTHRNTAPWPVRNLTATGGDGQVRLTWTAPRWTGGEAITGYQYRHCTGASCTLGSATTPEWTPITGSDANTTSHTVTGLSGGGASYGFEVRAVNSVGGWTNSSNAFARATVTGRVLTRSVSSLAQVGDAVVNEGEQASYTVTLDAAATGSVAVPFTVADAATNGTDGAADYTPVSATSCGTLTIPDSVTNYICISTGSTGTIQVNTVDDDTAEAPEDFTVTIGKPITAAGTPTTQTAHSVTTTIAGGPIPLRWLGRGGFYHDNQIGEPAIDMDNPSADVSRPTGLDSVTVTIRFHPVADYPRFEWLDPPPAGQYKEIQYAVDFSGRTGALADFTSDFEPDTGVVVIFTNLPGQWVGVPFRERLELGLDRPIYARTAAYGHFGRAPDADGGFSWERTDLVDPLRVAFGA